MALAVGSFGGDPGGLNPANGTLPSNRGRGIGHAPWMP